APRLRPGATAAQVRSSRVGFGQASVRVLGRASGRLGSAPTGTAQLRQLVVVFGSGVGPFGTGVTHRRPNESFKPKPLRYAVQAAGKACHLARFPTRISLTLVLDVIGETHGSFGRHSSCGR